MLRRIKDKATPKTGGVTNRAHSTTASRFEPGISKSGFPPDLSGCNYAKRTQLPPCPRPKCAKRTQFATTATQPHTNNAKRTQSQPDPRPNPPKNAKRTQFPPTQQPIAKCQTLFVRNEPKYHPPQDPNVEAKRRSARCGPKRTQFATTVTLPHTKNAKRTQSTPRKNTKRTQFPHTKCPAAPYLCETNPIPQAQLPKANSQQPKNAKQTQSTVPPASRRPPQPPNYAQRTQFRSHRHPATLTVPALRKTNPIPHSPGSPKATQPPNIQSTIYNPPPGFNSRLTYRSPIRTLMR